MQITNVECPVNKYYLKCPDVVQMEGITVHNTYNDASAMAEISYMLGNNNKCSFHAAIDNYRVVTGLPFNRSCYAAGDGRYGYGNSKTINIEICYSLSGEERFDEAEEMAAAYIALLLRQYGWGIERVGTHQDRSGKYCPHRTLDYGWQSFLNKIQAHIDWQNQPTPSEQEYGGELNMARVYQNGSTPEPVYADTDLTRKIGCLSPGETAEYLDIDNDRPLVRYVVDGTYVRKCGYVRWKGGCK